MSRAHWALLSALAVAGVFVFADLIVAAGCWGREVAACQGKGNRFASVTVLRALAGVPIVAAWWRPHGRRRWAVGAVVVLSSPLWLRAWSAAALYAFEIGGGSHFALQVVDSSEPILLALAMLVAAPVFEEMSFRGLLLDWSRRWPVWSGVLLTALAWTALHAQYELRGMVILFAMGVVLATARLITGSILAPIFLHVWWNWCVLDAAVHHVSS